MGLWVRLLNLILEMASVWPRVREGSLLEGVAPGPDGKIGVLTIFPHQDDESIYSAGTLLKLKKDPRVRLCLLNLTRGEKSPSHLRLGISPEQMGRIRDRELLSVASVLGAEEVIQLDYSDLGLEGADPSELRQRVAEAITRAGAQIIITFDPFGFYGHPDHRVANRVAMEAFKQSRAQRLYYVSLPKWQARMRVILCDFSMGMKWYLPLVYHYLTRTTPVPPTLRIDIRAEKKLKRLALDQYASQKYHSNLTAFLEMSVVSNYEWFALAAENPGS